MPNVTTIPQCTIGKPHDKGVKCFFFHKRYYDFDYPSLHFQTGGIFNLRLFRLLFLNQCM